MSAKYLVNCSIIFTELPILERPAAAKAAGFDAVEFWWPFAEAVPADADVDTFVAAVRNAGVKLVGLNFFAGDMPGGDRGLVSWPDREKEFRESVEIAVSIGQRLGVSGFNALYGNRIDGHAPGAQDALAVENLALAAERANTIGAKVFLEPVSGADRYPLKTAADVVRVIEELEGQGVAGVGLLADFYHMSVNGDDVSAAIAEHSGRIVHVQIADAPGRGEPGTGQLSLQRWIDEVYATGYSGWIGLEYKPATDDPFGWLPAAERAAIDVR
jgi:hydroxypyruvate isomerase